MIISNIIGHRIKTRGLCGRINIICHPDRWFDRPGRPTDLRNRRLRRRNRLRYSRSTGNTRDKSGVI